jgi:hypothetical protein
MPERMVLRRIPVARVHGLTLHPKSPLLFVLVRTHEQVTGGGLNFISDRRQ